jgi:hypothetical protein
VEDTRPDGPGDGRCAGGFALLAAEGDALAEDRLERLAQREGGDDDFGVALVRGVDVGEPPAQPAGLGIEELIPSVRAIAPRAPSSIIR